MDYEEIISNLNVDAIISMMKKLGANKYIDKDTYIIFPTICHNENAEDASMKLYFYKDTKLFVCFTECNNMSIFKFLKTYYETRGIEYDWYQDIYMAVRDCSNFKTIDGFVVEKYKSLHSRYESKKRNIELPEYNKSVLECFIDYAPIEWLNDGISYETMKKFNIKYSISQNKIIIPHYDINNRLIGIRGRALNDWEVENIGKYAPIKVENIWYKHPLSMNLYGLNFNKDNIAKTGICFIAEGEKSVLQSESFSYPNCTIATCGSTGINKYQLNILMKVPNLQEIVLCYDREEKPGEEKYFNKLYENCKKYSHYINTSFIYPRNGEIELKQSPFDKGEQTFFELLRRRVRVI